METASAHNFNMMTTEFQGMDPIFGNGLGLSRLRDRKSRGALRNLLVNTNQTQILITCP